MVWLMTAGGPSHATETVATNVYVTAFRFLEVGYAPRRAGEHVSRLGRPRWTTVFLGLLALVWLCPG